MASADAKQPHSFSRQVPEGDTHERSVCDTCGFIDYVNPKIVVGSVATWEDRILICRRAIEPRLGFWTLPAGYLEVGETVEAGAMREAREEANADISLETVLAVYSIPRISQVQIMFRAALNSPDVSAGQESLDVRLVTFDEIPWDELAFPSVHWALTHFREVLGKDVFVPFSNPEGALGNAMPGSVPGL